MLALERELGTKLLDRTTRGVLLTQAGKTFREHALVVQQDLERAREAIQATDNGIVGRVAVGLPATVAIVLAQPLIRSILNRHPLMTIHLVESHSGFLKEWLRAGLLDLAVLFHEVEVEVGHDLELLPLLTEALCLVGPPRRGKHPPSVPLSSLRDVDLLMPSRLHGLRRLVDSAMILRFGRPPNVKLEIDALPTLKRMIENGLGYTVLPQAAVRPEAIEKRLVSQRIVSPGLERHATLAFSSRRPRTAAHAVVAHEISEVCRELIKNRVWVGTGPPPAAQTARP